MFIVASNSKLGFNQTTTHEKVTPKHKPTNTKKNAIKTSSKRHYHFVSGIRNAMFLLSLDLNLRSNIKSTLNFF